ncbi:MAG: DUF2905 domain-containing protein [Anaerovibrio sp.]|uniref:DUF2905 domain-containing protein n=1 Tax=Anaerovibrio sp. TaxID=1872532 RepID=UPI0025BB0F58|nr:DUF2905 domain-containing protein [Anaerovibrio sp.]MBE6100087.1 DUF2905 domain-containing protein [Anaerovibrio sp.]
MADLGKMLIYIGIILVVVGCVIHFGGKLVPFGRLPGDINIVGENSSFHFPVVTCIIISIVLSVIANLFLK